MGLKIESYYTYRKREKKFSRSIMFGNSKPREILQKDGFIFMFDLEDNCGKSHGRYLKESNVLSSFEDITHVVYYTRIGAWGLPFTEVYGKFDNKGIL